MPEVPGFLDVSSLATRIILLAVILGGLALALGRTPLTSSAKATSWSIIAGVVLAWFAVAFFLSRQGFFQAGGDVTVPAIPFAIVLPVVVGLFLLMRSKTVATIIDATSLSWLVGIQFYRVLGGIFLVLWAAGDLPGEFALPAGSGDVLIGILALPVALVVARGASNARNAAYAWNVLGILDLVVAVAMGFLTSPGRFQQFALDDPNILTTAYPLVMIPAFAVPVSLILHGLCLWKLRRLGAGQATPPSGVSSLAAG